MKTLLRGQLVEKEKRLKEATPDEVELKKLMKIRDKQKSGLVVKDFCIYICL